MRSTINLSRMALGKTGNNPPVGAILVKDSSSILGYGVTAIGGRPHAEAEAVQSAIANGYNYDDISGATIYSTLEPCSHYGKTPPCAKMLIDLGIKRVVISIKDIDPRVDGRGIAMLRDAGIEVVENVVPWEGYKVLAPYIINRLYNRSYVCLKLAIGKDGSIGSRSRPNFSISNDLSKNVSHNLRMMYDAILVGINTVICDDPMLNVRVNGINYNKLIRIVLDSKLRISETSRLVQTARDYPLWIICTADADKNREEHLRSLGARVIIAPKIDSRIDIISLLRLLRQEKVNSVLVEGGADIVASFMSNGVADRYALFNSNVCVNEEPIYAPLIDDLEDYYRVNEMKLRDDVFYELLRREKCLQG